MCHRVEWEFLQQKRRRYESADVISNADYLFADCSVNNGGCQHHCNEYAADEWCSCHNGYKVSTTYWKNCVDINECDGEKGQDYNRDCQNCVNTPGSYTCECEHGYELDQPSSKKCIGELCGCNINQHYCHECVNTIGSYICRCDQHYELDPQTNRKCIGEDYHEDCQICVNTIGSYTCDCKDGYELDPSTNQTCIERGVDFNADCHHCYNSEPGYTCECNDGYKEDNTAIAGICAGVDYDRDCHKCINTKGSHTCGCDSGYELHPNGKSCVDTNECQRGLHGVDCHNCVNLIGGHTCICNDTYVLDINNNNETCIGQCYFSSSHGQFYFIITFHFSREAQSERQQRYQWLDCRIIDYIFYCCGGCHCHDLHY
ncbi:hypothetical protein CAPTEDRAFT_124775 [Capitella teleta]|uniref:EGF-like domain-containing protein n=1 Tax=Capitella teleta TaxID=283909 RepID=R7TKG7_CAPTE|nr:hypothetical protein CAPTEDRAFT_124775 [Capitella teleta]|eukprot:ELT92036.1 hypothetical protein CAPTEDRAFT_124775 [Capitella teleta]